MSSNLEQWKYHPILQWDQLSKKFPWGVFMLQGAGLAIADAVKVSRAFSVRPNVIERNRLGIGSLLDDCRFSQFRCGSVGCDDHLRDHRHQRVLHGI